jgi:beta-xylosidase
MTDERIDAPTADASADLDRARKIWSDRDREAAERIAALLGVMSLEEKLAQLGSSWLGSDETTGPDDGAGGRGNTGNVAPMQEAFAEVRAWEDVRTSGLGHLTRPFGTKPITPHDGVPRLAELQRDLQQHNRLAIPAVAHEECLTGFTTLGATVFPTPLALAATFHPDLVEQMTAAIGHDMRSVDVHQGLSPVLDVVRDQRWGRVEETMGEDPYLVGVIGSAYVRGLESAGIIATLKHFAGYSASRAARNHAPVPMGPRELREIMLVPFEMGLRLGGARSVMNSYADVDGVPAGADPTLLTGILRDEWGFDGTVVSDYGTVHFLMSMHRVAPSLGVAAALALTAGIDVELPEGRAYLEPLAEAVRSGRVDETFVDRALERVLRQKLDLGLLDADWEPSGDPELDLDPTANRELARELAQQSVVLLKNDRLLPLDGRVGGSAPSRPTLPSRIAVIGPCADDPQAFLGCYSYPNHVLPRYPELGLGIAVPSLVESLRGELPDVEVTTLPGCPVEEIDRSGIPAAVEAAADAGVVVLVVGDRAGLFGRGTSGEGNDAEDLRLPGVQHELATAVLEAGTPVVLVVVSGRPYALGGIADRAGAAVQAFMPGEEGGAAIAGVLSGRVNPSGRLPVQIAESAGGQPATYLHPPLGEPGLGISSADTTVCYPFGHGLSYTTFAHADLRLEPAEISTDGQTSVSCTVTNTGQRAGAEVVQLYLDDPVAEVVRPVRQLAGFRRVELEPGAEARVTFELHADRLSYVGRELARIVDSGEILLMVGPSSADLPLQATLRVTGPTRLVGHDRVLDTPVEVTTLASWSPGGGS